MARPTNTDLHNEIKLVKQDLCYVKDGQKQMQADLKMIKKIILNPDSGTIARVNKNTDFRKSTSKVLWSLWVVVLGIIGKIIFFN